MQKIKLDLDSLAVASFETAAAADEARGTVMANSTYVPIQLGIKAGQWVASYLEVC